MAAMTGPSIAAGIIFSLLAAAAWFFPPEESEAGEMDAKMVFRLLLGPACLAVLILLLDAEAGHLYLVRWLRP